MPVDLVPITDFTAGELSSKFSGRWDLPLYRKGCQTLDNWVPFAQGGVHSRPGTSYLGTTKSGNQSRLIPFVVNESNAFVVELTNNLIRIWKNGALVGAPTEVVTTYTTAELFKIQYQKVRNQLYLVHYNHPIAVLTWNGGTSFSLANLTITFGTGVSAWQATTAYAVGDVVSNGSPTKLYVCITAGTSAGSGGPTTEADDITDGTAHWFWEATKPFSQSNDYPSCIAHFRGRMWYGGSVNDPQTVWASEPFWYGDFNYFNMIDYTSTQIKDSSTWADPEVPETEEISYSRQVFGEGSAFFFEIASDREDDIYWLLGADALIIGTSSSEWIVPENVNALWIIAKQRSGHGSAFVQPTMFQDAPVFVQGTLSKGLLREYAYLSQSSELSSPDLTFGADHMLENGASQLAVARLPQPTLFAVTNGELACLVHHKVYGVTAWYHVSTDGGTIESVCVIPGSTDDEVYISVNRANGRVVEKFDLLWNTTQVPLDSYVDIASIAGGTQSGLDRFDGETVTIYNVTDGTIHTAAVAAGSLSYPDGDDVGDHVVIGMAFTCRGQTMRLGPMQGQVKRSTVVTARVLSSLPFKVGYAETEDLQTSQRPDGIAWSAAYTGDVQIHYAGNWDRDAWVWFIQDQPYRTTILSLIPEVSAR